MEIEKQYSPAEIARLIGWDASTVTRVFEKERGIIKLPNRAKREGEKRRTRRYRNIRIPVSVFQRVMARMKVA